MIQKTYQEKPIMTQPELFFWNRLKKIIGKKFIITPQIALSSLIEKQKFGYANELFRTIDFGIFTKTTYEVLALIELNDNSHFLQERQERDIKVKNILKEAGLDAIFITFWMHKQYTDKEIKKSIKKIIKQSKHA